MSHYDILIDNRSDPVTREVLGDYELSRGYRSTRLGVALLIANGDGFDDPDEPIYISDADADAVDSADRNDAADSADDEGTDDVGTYPESADAADVNEGNDDDDLSRLLQEINMRDGLKVIQLPGRYGYSVTRVGWMRRVAGDEWELLPGARTIIRTGSARTLDSLASSGPSIGSYVDHRLTDASTSSEEIHRLVIRRCLQADESAWEKFVPRPDGWGEAA